MNTKWYYYIVMDPYFRRDDLSFSYLKTTIQPSLQDLFLQSAKGYRRLQE